MAQSTDCFESALERRSAVNDGPEHVDVSACEGNDGLMVAFSLAPLAVVEGAAVVVGERAEGGLVEIRLRLLLPPVGLLRKRVLPDTGAAVGPCR